MKKTLIICASIVIVGVITFTTQQSSNASSSGAVAGVAGAPMDASGATCTNCHSGTATSTTGIISSDIPLGGFVPGSTYNFTVTMSGSAAYGFEITPQTATSNAGVGSLIAGTGTQISSTKYLTHTAKKTGASATWNFQWTAPTSGNTVTFYGSFLFANNNFGTSGDMVMTSSVTYTAASTVGIEDIAKNEAFFSVFPNPAENEIKLLSIENLNSASVYSLDGKLMKVVSEQELTSKSVIISDLEAGIYFIKAESNAKSVTAKFTKK